MSLLNNVDHKDVKVLRISKINKISNALGIKLIPKNKRKQSNAIRSESMSNSILSRNPSKISLESLSRQRSETDLLNINKNIYTKIKPVYKEEEQLKLLDFEKEGDKFIDIKNDTLTEREKVDSILKEMNMIKKLDLWDYDNIERNISDFKELNNSFRRKSTLTRGINSFNNSIKMIKEKLLISDNSYFNNNHHKIQEIATRKEKEEEIMFKHNISQSGNKFNFDLIGTSNNKQIKNSKYEPKTVFMSKDVDYYREIIKEKLKIEGMYKKDINEISKFILEKKKEKIKLRLLGKELYSEYSRMKFDYELRRDVLNNSKENLEKKINRTNHHLDQTYSKKESPDSTFTKLKIVKKSSFEEETSTIRSQDIKLKLEKNENEIYRLTASFIEAKNKFEEMLEENKNAQNQIERELKQFMDLNQSIIRDQRAYYQDILAKGVDVRNEGLVWVVRRLIELNMLLDYSLFPKFMDNNHINYLIKLAHLQIETSQLKNLFKNIKLSQLSFLFKNQDDSPRKSNSNSKYSQLEAFDSNPPRVFAISAYDSINEKTLDQTGLSGKTLHSLKNLLSNDKLNKNVYEEKVENIQIAKIVEKYRKKIMDINCEGFDSKYNDEESILKYFFENQKQREFFEDLLVLRNKIKSNEEEITKMMKEELNNFKRKNLNIRNVSHHNSVQYETIFANLFGNNITI
jgi:hypothetical protein